MNSSRTFAPIRQGLAALGLALAVVALPGTAAAASPFTVRSVMELDTPLTTGDFVWNDEGVGPGALSIVVDLDSETMHVYRGGNEIGLSKFIYGDDRKPTPLGTFRILQKDVDHVSNIYVGAPMPYMLRLTNGGISIHGSARIESDIATHGCVGLPKRFAAILFAAARLGDPVLITRNWVPDQHAG